MRRSAIVTFRSPIRSGQALRDAVDAASIALHCTRCFGALGGPPVTRHPPSTAACASRSPTPSHNADAGHRINNGIDMRDNRLHGQITWRWVSHRRSARHGAPDSRCVSGRTAGRNDAAIAGRSDARYGYRQPGRERAPGTAPGPAAGAKRGVAHAPSLIVRSGWRRLARQRTPLGYESERWRQTVDCAGLT